MIKPNSWNGWDPLKEVLVGVSLPNNWFDDHNDKRVASGMRKIMEQTNEDLDNFVDQLQKRGVNVHRCNNNHIPGDSYQEYLDTVMTKSRMTEDQVKKKLFHNKLGIPRPNLTPRDYLIVMGDKILCTYQESRDRTSHLQGIVDKEHIVSVDQKFLTYDEEYHGGFGAPAITRVGNDIIVDEEDVRGLAKYMKRVFPNFNVRAIAAGGHTDGIFSPIKPGHIVSIDKADYCAYELTFPEWDVKYIEYPQEMHQMKGWDNQKEMNQEKWWADEANNNPELAEFINQWCEQWVGYCIESVFEVNMLTINPELVFAPTESYEARKYVEEVAKMEYVHVPFRHRRFWDGGLHCLTVDLVREGTQQSHISSKYDDSKWL